MIILPCDHILQTMVQNLLAIASFQAIWELEVAWYSLLVNAQPFSGKVEPVYL